MKIMKSIMIIGAMTVLPMQSAKNDLLLDTEAQGSSVSMLDNTLEQMLNLTPVSPMQSASAGMLQHGGLREVHTVKDLNSFIQTSIQIFDIMAPQIFTSIHFLAALASKNIYYSDSDADTLTSLGQNFAKEWCDAACQANLPSRVYRLLSHPIYSLEGERGALRSYAKALSIVESCRDYQTLDKNQKSYITAARKKAEEFLAHCGKDYRDLENKQQSLISSVKEGWQSLIAEKCVVGIVTDHGLAMFSSTEIMYQEQEIFAVFDIFSSGANVRRDVMKKYLAHARRVVQFADCEDASVS